MAPSHIDDTSNASNTSEPQVSKSREKSEIAEFYAGTTIFVTGGTGFIGKLLIEKLLRSCPRIKKIYMLVRPKKGMSAETRFKENFEEIIFERLRKEQPNFLSKIIMVEGTGLEDDSGMTLELQEMMKETNIIFHAAATVRFAEKLRVVVNTNVRTTKHLLVWARQLSNLKAFVYISTAFSNCMNNTVEEIHYKSTMDVDKLIELVNCSNDDELLAMESILRGKSLNNYTFSKAAAENAVLKYGDGLPTGIVRPSIVIPTSEEPIRAWINNVYGITGLTVVVGMGLLRTGIGKIYSSAEIIPADYVVANIIAAAWDVGTRQLPSKMEENSIVSDEEKIPIYNSVTSAQNPITWNQYRKLNAIVGYKYPSMKAIWYFVYYHSKHFYMYQINNFILHTIPGIIGDSIARLLGHKPMLMDTYRKINKFIDALSFFTTQEWNFQNENVQKLWSKLNSVDRKLFNFNVENLDWNDYFQYHWKGVRTYVLKDPLDNIKQARARYNKLRVAHYTVVIILSLLMLWIAVVLLSFLW